MREEAEQWRSAGIVDGSQAERIVDGYESDDRAASVRVLLGLGAIIAGVGTIWLVASNLDWDRISPLGRFTFAAAVWLALVALAELAYRRERTSSVRLAPLAGALRLLAAIAYGAAIFQVAQSLQVPAYEPALLGAWAGGAIAYAYAARAAAALVVGTAVGAGWIVWELADRTPTGGAFVAGLVIAALALIAIAALNARLGAPRLARPWRAVGAVCALASLLALSLPGVLNGRELPGAGTLAAGLAVAALCLAVAWRADRLSRVELLGALGVAAAVLLLALFAPDSESEILSSERPEGEELALVLAAGAVFLAAAVGVAVAGAVRSAPELTNVAAAGLMFFVLVQSFATIAPIVSGATLFLVVGCLLITTALLIHRGRRRLAEAVAE